MLPCKQANAVGETVQKTKQNKEEKQNENIADIERIFIDNSCG